jgi:hypothetical protein
MILGVRYNVNWRDTAAPHWNSWCDQIAFNMYHQTWCNTPNISYEAATYPLLLVWKSNIYYNLWHSTHLHSLFPSWVLIKPVLGTGKMKMSLTCSYYSITEFEVNFTSTISTYVLIHHQTSITLLILWGILKAVAIQDWNILPTSAGCNWMDLTIANANDPWIIKLWAMMMSCSLLVTTLIPLHVTSISSSLMIIK